MVAVVQSLTTIPNRQSMAMAHITRSQSKSCHNYLRPGKYESVGMGVGTGALAEELPYVGMTLDIGFQIESSK